MKIIVKVDPNGEPQKGYFGNLFEAISQALGSIFGLNANITFSAHCGHWLEIGDFKGKLFAPMVDFFFGKNHCKKAWENLT